MDIKLAKHAGFCAGVERALNIALKIAGEGKSVYTLGPLVHNKQVVEYLKDRGIKFKDSLEDIIEGTVVIRSHGVGSDVLEKAKQKNIDIVDATCPFVKKVQEKISKLIEEGYRILIVGDPSHPEVKGLVGWSQGQALVIKDIDELEDFNWEGKIAVLAQTTLIEDFFNQVVEEIKKIKPQVLVNKTICKATGVRQKTAVDLAGKVELMIVIGGYNSSNTRKLAEICKKTGTPTYHIEEAAELKREWLENIKVTGVSAGASTPMWSIKEVIRRMSEYNNDNLKEEEEQVNEEPNEELNEETNEEPNDEEGVMEEEVEETPEVEEDVVDASKKEDETSEERKEDIPEQEMSQKDLEKDIVSLEKGDIVKGKVVQVTAEELLVDVGYKADGIIPRTEVNVKTGESLEEHFQVGDELDLFVLKVPATDDDKLLLSKKRYDREKQWKDLEKSFEEEEELTCEVIEVVKGGLIVDVGIRGFLPASLVDLRYVPDLQQFVGEKIGVKVIELNRSKNKAVVSRKKVLEEEMQEKKKETLADIEENMVIKGIVRRLTDFGAFVDIGGIDGLVHISEISWQRIDHPADVLNVGEEVEVKILSINIEEERISLSIKQAMPDPWSLISSRFNAGDLVEGKIKCIVDFGIFVEIMPGVEGLVHISQLAEDHVTHPSEIVEEGEDIKVKILDVNPEDKRISLSLKEARKELTEEKKDKVEGKKDSEQDTAVQDNDESRGPGVTLGDVFGDLFEKNKDEDEKE